MSNKVNLLNLKRKQIRKEMRDGIIIYNPSPKEKQKILNIITENTNGSEINIDGQELFLRIMPILTNVEIPSDMSKELIQEILDDPDDLLIEIMDELKIIVKSIAERTIKTIDELKEMPKDKLIKIVEEYNINEEKTPEQKRIEELEKELEASKKLLKQSNNKKDE